MSINLHQSIAPASMLPTSVLTLIIPENVLNIRVERSFYLQFEMQCIGKQSPIWLRIQLIQSAHKARLRVKAALTVTPAQSVPGTGSGQLGTTVSVTPRQTFPRDRFCFWGARNHCQTSFTHFLHPFSMHFPRCVSYIEKRSDLFLGRGAAAQGAPLKGVVDCSDLLSIKELRQCFAI